MKRQIVYILSIIMLIGLLGSCSKKSDVSEETSKSVTRGQWLTMLAETFNLDTYHETTPYYADVDSNSELFSYIQSSKEWEILSIYQEDSFNANTPVTRREVASTAALAAGFKPEESSYDQDGQFVEGPSVNYAMEHGITENKELSDRMTFEECETALENAKNIYLNGDGTEKISVIYNENLVDLKKVRPNFIDVDETENTVTFLNDVLVDVVQDNTGVLIVSIQTLDETVDVREGDVFITLPMQGQSAGVAYKVLSIERTDRGVTFTTETPTLGDLYDELVYHATISLDESHITWADGVTVSPVSSNSLLKNRQANEFHIELLSNQQAARADDLSYHLSKHIMFGKGTIKALSDNSDALKFSEALEKLDLSSFSYKDTPSLADFIGPRKFWTKSLPKEEKYTNGYKFEGNFSFDLNVTPNIEYHKSSILGHEIQTYPESASLTVQSIFKTDLKIEGTLDDEYQIAEFSIPTAITGLTIDGSLCLYTDLNGSIQVGVELKNKNRVDWNAPINFRHAEDKAPVQHNIEALVDSSFGPKISVAACAFSYDIIGMDLKASADVSTTGTLEGQYTELVEKDVVKRNYTESIRLRSDLYIPIISLTARGPDFLVDSIGLEKTWDIISQEKASHHLLLSKTYPFWEMSVTLDSNGAITIPIEDTNPIKNTEPVDIGSQVEILSAFQNGDFSHIAGTYQAHSGYATTYDAECPDITIDQNGTVLGGGMVYSWGYHHDFKGIAPISFNIGDSDWGKDTLVCTIEDTPGTWIEEAGIAEGRKNEFYVVYLPGASAFNGALTEELNKIRIRYVIIDGGIEDMVYTKID